MKYAFPLKHGGLTLENPTGYAAPPALREFDQCQRRPSFGLAVILRIDERIGILAALQICAGGYQKRLNLV